MYKKLEELYKKKNPYNKIKKKSFILYGFVMFFYMRLISQVTGA